MASPAKKRSPTEPGPAPSDAKSRRRRLWWREALTGYWGPVVVFGIALLLYIFLIELHTPSQAWARPLLKGFGLLMLGWVLGLMIWRRVSPRERKLRAARTEAEDLHRELARLLRKHSEKLDPKVQRRISEGLSALEEHRLSGDLDKLTAELNRLSELAEKHLSAWRQNRTLAFLIGIAKALAIALAIRAVLIEPYRIPSGSMIPTLEIGDQIFINKFLYGVRVPFMNWVPFVIVREPQRGDVVVFENPNDSSIDLVKRIVAVGGDRVELRDKQLFINGVPQPLRVLEQPYVFYDQKDGPWTEESATLLEELLDGKPHPVLHEPERPPEPVETVVPPGHVFVLGDNRDNSADSRLGFGDPRLGIVHVPLGHIKGKAMIVWLALGHDGLGSSLFGGTGLRTDRLYVPVR